MPKPSSQATRQWWKMFPGICSMNPCLAQWPTTRSSWCKRLMQMVWFCFISLSTLLGSSSLCSQNNLGSLSHGSVSTRCRKLPSDILLHDDITYIIFVHLSSAHSCCWSFVLPHPKDYTDFRSGGCGGSWTHFDTFTLWHYQLKEIVRGWKPVPNEGLNIHGQLSSTQNCCSLELFCFWIHAE